MNGREKQKEPFSNDKKEIERTREKILENILFFSTIIGFFLWFVGTSEAVIIGQIFLSIIYTLIYLPVVLIFIFRKRLSYNQKSVVFLGSFFVLTIINLLFYGFSSAAIPLMIASSIIATVLFGKKAGLITVGLNVIPFSVISILILLEIVAIQIDVNKLLLEPISWATALSVFILISVTTVLSQGVIQSSLMEKIKAIRKKDMILNDNNQELKNERERAEFYLDLLSHDIGNIHQGISLSLQMAKNKSRGDQEIEKNLDISLELMDRSMDLVKSVKLFSNLRYTKPRLEPIDLDRYIKQQIEVVKGLFPERKIRIEYSSTEKGIKIMAEPLVGQIFQNLLHNSFRFISTKVNDGYIKITMKKIGKNILIEFSDNGPGIDDDMKGVLFDRIRYSRDRKHRGLGLILVKELVERYDGEISVGDRIKGNGSKGVRFKITFPSIEN